MINYYQNARTKPEVFKQLFCKNLLFVYYYCPLGENRQDSWSQLNYILYVVTGKKSFQTSSKSWLLNPGTAVFVKKGACIIEKIDGEDLCLMAFFIPDSYLRSFIFENLNFTQKSGGNSAESELIIPLQVNEMMLAYYDSILPYFSSEVKPPEELLELKFKELLFNIILNPANIDLNQYLHTLILPQANNIQPILEANFCYNLKLEDFAKLCNRSLSSFKRDFNMVYHMPPARWLLQKRIAYSVQLLNNPKKTIADISFESGFEDSTHFSHAFKKHFGLSPLKYRQDNFIAAEVHNKWTFLTDC